MKQILLFMVLCTMHNLNAQFSFNSGSMIAPNATLSVGEIIVKPHNTNQTQSGLISMVVEMNGTLLEVSSFKINETISIYPNPTNAKINFVTTESLQNKKINVYNNLGQFVFTKFIDDSKSIDLSSLSSGVYILKFDENSNKSFKIIKK
jgi:Secretion system C-terminal sorting domain